MSISLIISKSISCQLHDLAYLVFQAETSFQLLSVIEAQVEGLNAEPPGDDVRGAK
jgi:hypothetical protein